MRSIWTGSISFGLINIPIHMYTASQEKELKFVLLHKKDFSEIRYARICKAEEKEVPWSEIVKGYEYEKGNFVVLTEEELNSANLKKTKTIEILNFTDEEEINSIYYVKPYFLQPDKNAEKAYSILCEALKQSKKVGLAKYVIRNREHIAVIKAYDNMIILNELRYETELVQHHELKLPTVRSDKKEVDLAIKLIDHLSEPFEPQKYSDTYEDEIKEIIKKKAKGKPIHPKTTEAPEVKVHDIMSLLKASLEEKKKPKKVKKTA